MKGIDSMRMVMLPLLALMLSAGAYGIEIEKEDDNKPAIQTASAGQIDRHYIYSPQMRETITVDVWTPLGYPADDGHHYPVIYMHDGQNLFDATTSWNRQSWEMDSVTSALIAAGEIEAPVIVGIHSVNESRLGDLMPENVTKHINGVSGGDMQKFLTSCPIRGNAYAAFMVETLKPAMDSIYRLAAGMDSTFVMGSSMGGLMSVYAMSEYPSTFGAAACLSTHWVGTLDGDTAFSDAMYDYLADHLPRDGRHRLYLDHGTISIDSLYGPANERVVSLAGTLGYKTGGSCGGCRPSFDNFIDEGAGHEERYWAARVARPLRFLLGKMTTPSPKPVAG